jgi:enoyl-CoA hydratase/carnithine racemase
VEAAGSQRDAGAIIISGVGRVFSAGGDLDFLKSCGDKPAASNYATLRAFYGRILSVRQSPVPVIAALNGSAVGAGCCLAMASDFRIGPSVDAAAKFGFNFAALGFAPGIASSHLLPKLVGPTVALRMLTLDELLTPATALSSGFVDRAAPTDPVTSALELADELLASHRNFDSVMAGVQSIRDFLSQGLETALHTEATVQATALTSDAMRHGIESIIAKERPVYDSV